MSTTASLRVFVAVIAGAAGTAPLSTAAPPKRDYTEVELRTGDGATLAGRYWPGRMGPKSPAVIVLDDVGPGAKAARCDAVARELARAGCAVLCFDFRGHSGSTAVTAEFWADPTNRRLVRRGRSKEAIAATDFKAGYLPQLVNDVAAARAYLLRRNDAGECNAGQTIVVGFGRGAAIGALWVATEWARYRLIDEFPERLRDLPEGTDVAGCVWVAPDPRADGRTLPMLDWIRRAGQNQGVIQAWIYDRADTVAAGLAARCAAELNRGGDKLSVVREMTRDGARPITDDPALAGNVGRAVKFIREEREAPEWDDRDFADSRYLWQYRGWRTVAAKAAEERDFAPVYLDPLRGR
jgi:pimeloyl-ACP methyl ester carboxylesterase